MCACACACMHEVNILLFNQDRIQKYMKRAAGVSERQKGGENGWDWMIVASGSF